MTNNEVADLDDESTRSLRRNALVFVGSMVVHLIFVGALTDTLWSSHFRSIFVLGKHPSGGLAKSLSVHEDRVSLVMIVLGLVLGFVAARRLVRSDWRGPVVRLCVVALAPVAIETLAFSVQDGSVSDLDYLAPHSIGLLVLVVFGTAGSIVWDLWRVAVPVVVTPSGTSLEPSLTLERHKAS